jgi:hypothetical protein
MELLDIRISDQLSTWYQKRSTSGVIVIASQGLGNWELGVELLNIGDGRRKLQIHIALLPRQLYTT